VKGQLDKAVQEGEIALRLTAPMDKKTNVKFVLNLLGGAYFKMGQTDAALGAFRWAIRADPKFAESYYNLSCVLAAEQEKEKSLEYLRKAIKLNPEYREKAKSDNDFNSVRGDKDFEALLK
jgi:tetratricopeptide (TPR) repeat protein